MSYLYRHKFGQYEFCQMPVIEYRFWYFFIDTLGKPRKEMRKIAQGLFHEIVFLDEFQWNPGFILLYSF